MDTGPQITVFESPALLLQEAKDWLVRYEVKASLIIGLLEQLSKDIQFYGTATPFFSLITQNKEILALALITPPFPIGFILGEKLGEDRAKQVSYLLASKLIEISFPHVAGIFAENDFATIFAATWKELTGEDSTVQTKERLFSLKQVNPVTGVEGHMRVAVEADLELLMQWNREFSQEVFGKELDEAGVKRARTRILGGSMFLWINNGEPVAMAGVPRTSAHTSSVGPVYTPQNHRKKGYASALVAQLSQLKLDEGYRECCLFTDLANPTSNKIYEAIGYRGVVDLYEMNFVKNGKPKDMTTS